MNSRSNYRYGLIVAAGILSCIADAPGQTGEPRDPLRYDFAGKYGQVEVGGPFVGMEFHESRPAPSRISFYAPVANSIDLSTDYWKRGVSLPVVYGLRIGNGPVEWLSNESWRYELSPHRVSFRKKTDSLDLTITYEFCKTAPAAVISMTARNTSGRRLPIQLYTHTVLSLRTCQTYARRDSSHLRFDGSSGLLTARFDEVATDSAAVFVQNAGFAPVAWAFRAHDISCTDSGGSSWPAAKMTEIRDTVWATADRGAAAFSYVRSLIPGQSLDVVQIIGSCRESDAEVWAARLRSGWKEEIQAYDGYIRRKAQANARFVTGDTVLDRSATWARALIASNAHYLNGMVVPMPCPAEYNFFFTHDLLLTNLGAVQFDLARVRSNLLYVVSLAKDSVIPHAYYWRDDGYKTEFCDPENWNHLWFVLVSGSYLRHSLDDSTGRVLYPFLTRSIRDILSRLHPDGLMYAYRPDWWDIGHIVGPRAYLTALAIRSLREYLFISAFLGRGGPELSVYEKTADRMQRALTDRLWDPAQHYLTNDNEGERDYHYYAGSLTAVIYGLLDPAHADSLVTTAARELLEPRIGLRIAMPPDFSTDSVIAKFRFAGQEAGPPYAYANGGVWPHGNAWYALALHSVRRDDASLEFVRRVMTVDGVAQSPNGLPAMYEYRYSDPSSPRFGEIDKPSFLWAGGMYLQVLYRLFAVDESEWNIAITDRMPSGFDSVSCTLAFGNRATLTVRKEGGILAADGRIIPSMILPLAGHTATRWDDLRNTEKMPVLRRVNAVVHAVSYDPSRRRLTMEISSFEGHQIGCSVAGPRKASRAMVDGVRLQVTYANAAGGMTTGTVRFRGTSGHQRVVFEY